MLLNTINIYTILKSNRCESFTLQINAHKYNQDQNIISHDILHLGFNSWLYLSVTPKLVRRPCPIAIVNSPRIMNPSDILALLPIKPEDTTKIATTTKNPTRASIQYFQESIKYQAVAITTCDHKLGCYNQIVRTARPVTFDKL